MTDHEPDDKVMSDLRVMSRPRDNLVPAEERRSGEDPALSETQLHLSKRLPEDEGKNKVVCGF